MTSCGVSEVWSGYQPVRKSSAAFVTGAAPRAAAGSSRKRSPPKRLFVLHWSESSPSARFDSKRTRPISKTSELEPGWRATSLSVPVRLDPDETAASSGADRPFEREKALQRLRLPAAPAVAVRRGDPQLHHRAPGRRAARGYGDGEQSRDFTYVGNVVEASLLAMTADGVTRKLFDVATGERTTLNQLLDHLGALIGRAPDARYEPARPGDVRHSQADIGRAHRELGYGASISLEEGLRRTLAWYAGRAPTAVPAS